MAYASELIIKLIGEKDASFNAALASADKAVESSVGSIKRHAQEAAIGLGAVAFGAGAMAKGMLDGAAKMEQYRMQLESVLHSSKAAAETLAWARDFAAKTPFEVKGIVDATVQLEVYGQSSAKWLPLVGNLAAGMNKDLGETALAVAKAASGSAEGYESLRNTFGLTIPVLEKYGAHLAASGGISLKTAEDIKAASGAIEAAIRDKFGGSMDRQMKTFAGAMSNLSDSFHNLSDEIGATLIPAATAGAHALTALSELLRAMPDWMKATAGGALVAVAGIAGIAAAASGLVAVFTPLVLTAKAAAQALREKAAASTAAAGAAGVNATATTAEAVATAGAGTAAKAATPSIWAMTGSFIAANAAILAVGAALVGLGVWTNIVIEENKKAAKSLEELTRTQASEIQALGRYHHEWAGKSAEELNQMGVTRADLAKVWQAASGTERAEIHALMVALGQFEGAASSAGQAYETAAKAIEHGVKVGEIGLAEQIRFYEEQLALLKSQGAKQEEIWKVEEKLADLHKAQADGQKKAADEVAAHDEESRKRRLQAAMDYMAYLKAGNELSTQGEIDLINRVVDAYRLSADERAQLVNQLRSLEDRLREEAVAGTEARYQKQATAAEAYITAATEKANGAKDAEIAAINFALAHFELAEDKRAALLARRKQLIEDAAKAQVDADRQLNESLLTMERQRLEAALKDQGKFQEMSLKEQRAFRAAIAKLVETERQAELKALQIELENMKKAGADKEKLAEYEAKRRLAIEEAAQDALRKLLEQTGDVQERELKQQTDRIEDAARATDQYGSAWEGVAGKIQGATSAVSSYGAAAGSSTSSGPSTGPNLGTMPTTTGGSGPAGGTGGVTFSAPPPGPGGIPGQMGGNLPTVTDGQVMTEAEWMRVITLSPAINAHFRLVWDGTRHVVRQMQYRTPAPSSTTPGTAASPASTSAPATTPQASSPMNVNVAHTGGGPFDVRTSGAQVTNNVTINVPQGVNADQTAYLIAERIRQLAPNQDPGASLAGAV